MTRISKRNEEDQLKDKNLIQAAFDPLIRAYKSRISAFHHPAVQAQFYTELDERQQALFMFQVYHLHMDGLEEFYWWNAYFAAQPITHQAIKKSLRYFKAADLLSIVEATATVLRDHQHPTDLSGFEVSREALAGNKALYQDICVLYTRWTELIPDALGRIACQLRIASEGEQMQL